MNKKTGKKAKTLQIFSSGSIKIIATVAMFIDHFSKIVLAFIRDSIWSEMLVVGTLSFEQYNRIDDFIRLNLYTVGGLAFPLFCFLISEGYYHTHDRKKYVKRMFFFALLSELPFDIGFFSVLSKRANTFPFYWEYQNVFFTYFLSLLCLYFSDRIRIHFEHKHGSKKGISVLLSLLCIAIAASLSELLKCDYGAMGVFFILAFYFLRRWRVYQSLSLLILYIAITGNQPTIYIMLAAFVILLYNGAKGKHDKKYFFYFFYPLHIIALYLFTKTLSDFIT